MAKLSKLSRSIDGSVAIVTGAASGMGRATAHLFADEGARLAIFDISCIEFQFSHLHQLSSLLSFVQKKE